LPEDWKERELATSQLVLEAQVAFYRKDPDVAERFAEIARREEELARTVPDEPHLRPHYYIHLVSAANSWEKAGDRRRAVALCDEILAQEDLPPRLREETAHYRTEWQAALERSAAPIGHAREMELAGVKG
jgi:hypothetical protein